MNVEQLLHRLVAIPSVSGEEQEIAAFLSDLLQQQGYRVERHQVEGGRFNVIARKGSPETVLTTHMDTVPGQPEQGIDDTYIHGRGACDAKASIAAMIVAAEEAEAEDYALVFDVGEEDDFCGIERLMDREWPTHTAVMGEPTDMERIVGQKGLLTLNIRVEGETAHASRPEEGVNAIDRLYAIVEQLRGLQTEDSFFGRTAFNLSKIEGGVSDNVVPPEATAMIQFRTVTDNQRIVDELDRMDAEYEFVHDFGPVRLSDRDGDITSGFTESYYWRQVADEVILQGPGDPAEAHSNSEKIKKRQLKDAVATYRQYLEDGGTYDE